MSARQAMLLRKLILMQRDALARWWSEAADTPTSLVDEFRGYTGRTGGAPAWRHALAQLYVESGEHDLAADLVATDRRRGERWVATLPFDEFLTLSMTCSCANVLAAIGTPVEREDGYERLAPFSGMLVGDVAPTTGPVDQALARMAQSLGRPDVALVHSRSAIELSRQLHAAVAGAGAARRPTPTASCRRAIAPALTTSMAASSHSPCRRSSHLRSGWQRRKQVCLA